MEKIINPLEEAEKMVKDLNKVAGKRAKPVLQRYPLLFTFLITFGFAAILDGIKFFFEKQKLFLEHPLVLVLIGIVILLFTGTLYKKLGKAEE